MSKEEVQYETKTKQALNLQGGKEFQRSRHMELEPHFFPTAIKGLEAKFKAEFEEPHRRLKAAIHRCQATAYSKQGLSLAESE